LIINISAIVGKNGSGKSTILELFFLVAYLCDYKNILAYKKFKDDNNIVFEPDFSFNQIISKNQTYLSNSATQREIRFFNGLREFLDERIYVEIFYQNNADIFKLTVDTNLKDAPYWFKIEKWDKERFVPETIETPLLFYSIALNYSIHSLNSIDMGIWLESIFHKNDGYQTPLVINPKRDEGSLDIENEKELQKSRLLVNTMDILMSGKDEDPLFNSKVIRKVVFRYNYNKRQTEISGSDLINLDIPLLNMPYNNVNKESKYRIDSVQKIFTLKEYKSCSWIEKEAYGYIIYKAGRIIKNYPTIFNENNFRKNLKKIEDYDSHITFKIKQAINFINFKNYIKSKCEETEPELINDEYGKGFDGYAFKKDPKICIPILNEDNKLIENIYSEQSQDIVNQINFLPPPFFDYDIHFSEEPNDTFEKLSSGEKQQIYSIHTIMYHLRNISSVKDINGIKKYTNINIILDEIELYFHPEMQRQFIKKLLSSFEQLKKYITNNIQSINVLLATHSPFILSDIPSQNILKLKDGNPQPYIENEQTFGANIHDLLANDFFLENGFMGEFAMDKINEIIDSMKITHILNEATKMGKSFRKDSTKLEYIKKIKGFEAIKDLNIQSKDECKKVIDIVGEPMLYMSLMELYTETFNESKNDFIDEQIKKLKSLKNS